ncbi:MAG: hypothetical protein AB7P02_17270 [Alphaproteobacteria bacterium]
MSDPILVPARELRAVWTTVTPMVEAVRRRVGADWLAEDVYAALLRGNAGLYLLPDAEGRTAGIMVLQKLTEWGVDNLSVWVAYHRDPAKSIAVYWDWLVDKAREWACRRVTFQSPRAFAAILPVRPIFTTFAYEV